VDKILKGESFAAPLKDKVRSHLRRLAEKGVPAPVVCSVQLAPSQVFSVYAASQKKCAQEIGAEYTLTDLSSADAAEVKRKIKSLSSDQRIQGILVQMPIPEPLRLEEITALIDPAKDIEGITIFASESGHERDLCEPPQARQKPMTSSDAKYSIPFTVAVAVVRRDVVINDYTPEGIQDEQVLQIAQKVTPKYDEQLTRVKKGREPGIVVIRMKDGKAYSKRVDVPYGHSEKPLAWKDLIRKFRDCVSHSAKPVPEENVERVINLVAKLEEVDDVGRIIQLLT